MESQHELDLRKFVIPEFVFGSGARHLAGRYARNLGARKVLVVSDPGVMKHGWTDQVTASLAAEGLPHVVFSRVTSNPRAEEVMSGVQVYQNEGCNVIVAVGGGSPMDCAKGIGIASANKSHIADFEGADQVPLPGPPLICIPTTAGSSADVSQFAIITHEVRQVKMAIISKAVVPDVALIDPVTTLSMDADLTAFTGMDALVHAIEAYVSNAHSPMTDLHALEAIRLVTGNLRAVLANPQDVQLRGQMMLGSLYAGLAFSNASLGAVHAMAHSLGGYLDSPHGEANAILLEHVVAFNFDATPQRYGHIGQSMGLEMKAGKEKKILLEAIRQLRQAVGVHRTLGRLGLNSQEIPTLAQKAMQDACMVTNPRRPTREEIEVIYGNAL